MHLNKISLALGVVAFVISGSAVAHDGGGALFCKTKSKNGEKCLTALYGCEPRGWRENDNNDLLDHDDGEVMRRGNCKVEVACSDGFELKDYRAEKDFDDGVLYIEASQRRGPKTYATELVLERTNGGKGKGGDQSENGILFDLSTYVNGQHVQDSYGKCVWKTAPVESDTENEHEHDEGAWVN